MKFGAREGHGRTEQKKAEVFHVGNGGERGEAMSQARALVIA
jgi:hypothetical protein